MSFVVVVPLRSKLSRTSFASIALGFVVPMVHVTVAFAQGTGGGAAPANSATSGGGATSGTTTVVQGPTSTQFYPGGVAPPPPGQPLGGGNVQYSSSKPILGPNDRDGFDFRSGGGGNQTLHGGENSSFILGGGQTQTQSSGVVPNAHNVRRGDTLWGICDYYFHNPYQWPRIWSYNPQIQNPHWIYPGDQVKLRTGGADNLLAAQAAPGTGTGGIIDRRRQVPPDTLFLRNQGYIDDDTNNWGEINGAREDKMILSDYDEVYLRIASNRDVKIGQELTVFRPLRSVPGGKLIEIQGTVKVDQWNPKERIARARITETLDAIERGARVGPIQRRFEVIAPERNDKDIEAKVLTSVQPHNFYGQNQVVFLDKGELDGVKPGNRFLIIRKGDAWHKTQPSGASAARIALEDESPAAIEKVPRPRNDKALPEEVFAELRVISVRKNSSMALVTASRREIEVGDKAYARKGY